MSKVKRLPSRSRVKVDDTWDLSSLYPNDKAWERDLKKMKRQISGFAAFRGKLGESPKTLAKCLKFDSDFDRLAERLGVYAFLNTAQDQADGDSQNRMGQFQNIAARAAEEASFIRPELLALSGAKLKKLMNSPELKHYRLTLDRLVRSKPYTLGKREEQLLAMQSEMSQTASRTFRQLLDADMKFGVVKNEKGEQVELSNATFGQLLVSPSRKVRKEAFTTYYKQFEAHQNTIAATLNGSIQKDVYYARARGYDSALHAALFPDNVPDSVYEKLIGSVHRNLPALHRYYDLRRRKMKLRDLRHYDTYVPILSDLETRHTWKQAVKVIIDALRPLGDEYCSVLEQGLSQRWCDRYPNQGKQSGAFSCGSFDGDPYILMNYQPTVLNDVFTLAHEAGHSMHSYLSSSHQSFEYYDYTIFVAEVASTFNEELLSHHLLENTTDKKRRAFLINREIDDIRGTIFRQTMFAEFEKITHEMAEAGEPLTLQAFQTVYRDLLVKYFGPDFTIDDQLSLECLRIPHFYRAFYVYKYATGLSAAIALSQRVLKGGETDLQAYLNFLKSGCSKDPLDLLRDAGVDMERPQPVNTALKYFSQLVDELDDLL
ncbi:MAG: oligoendopeptidase F [Pirellulaceae bacterium]|nr:oligoendopeptidase F [Pirellulaceae bacterium]